MTVAQFNDGVGRNPLLDPATRDTGNSGLNRICYSFPEQLTCETPNNSLHQVSESSESRNHSAGAGVHPLVCAEDFVCLIAGNAEGQLSKENKEKEQASISLLMCPENATIILLCKRMSVAA